MKKYAWILFLLNFLIPNPLLAQTCEQQHCIAVIDAGSTGSRLHLFSYDEGEGHKPIHITERWAKKITPGIATIPLSPDAMRKYIQQLFKDAPTYSAPVYLYATAGMRLLPESQQKERHDLIKKIFKEQSQWPLKDSKTISGADEGVFAWLSVNYQENQDWIGVLDVGGASTQIAFPVINTEAIRQEDIRVIHHHGLRISLFVHSFLGLGQSEVARSLAKDASCFPKDYPLSSGEVGQGDATGCMADLTALINKHQVPAIVRSAMATATVDAWYAFGGPAMVVNAEPFTKLFPNGSFTPSSFLSSAVSSVCNQDWSALAKKYPHNDFLSAYCMLPSFYYSLSVDGYGLNQDGIIKTVHTGKTIEDWTLGVVVGLGDA